MSKSKYSFLLLALLVAGCSGAVADSSKDEQAEAGSPSKSTRETTHVSIHVPAMSCPGGCAPVVEQTLAALPGVAECKVDFPSKIARCEIEPKLFDAEEAIAALTVAGFKDSTILNAPENEKAE